MPYPKRTRLALLAALVPIAAALGMPATGSSQTPPDQVSVPSNRTIIQDGQKGRFLMDGTWYFRRDDGNQGLGLGFQRQTSLDGWSPVTVPNAWNAGDYSDQSDFGGIGWYRKDFRLPSSAKNLSWILRFESVNYRSTIFLNGRKVGSHEGVYLPFEVLAKNASRTGVNHLVVRVDSRRHSGDLPAGVLQTDGRPGGGWWDYGGILREVYLRRVDRVDISKVYTRPILPCARCAARLVATATVANYGRGKKTVHVHGSVGGKGLRFRSVKVAAGRTKSVTATARFSHPRLWQPGSPNLYGVRVTASGGGSAEYDTHIGFRSIRVTKHGLVLLNGHRIELRGASMQEDSPNNGAALSEQQLDQNVASLKQLGANITRGQYPLHPRTLELLDQNGILDWQQIPFNRARFNIGGADQLDDIGRAQLRRARRKALSYLHDTIVSDGNHASVLAWSTANEPPPRPTSAELGYYKDAIRMIHSLDPTRLAAVDIQSYPTVPQVLLYQRFDAIGLTNYSGWYAGPGGTVGDRTVLRPTLNLMHAYYPHQALFVTEFGAEANRDGPIDEKGTYQFQQNLLDYHLDIYDKTPFVNGAIIWILKDFNVQPGWDGGNPRSTPPTLTKGLIDFTGNPKPSFSEIARRFHATPPLR
ncbi:MAG: glycoside hydrolase family 2 protein [Thermoleophilaceae bacterium]